MSPGERAARQTRLAGMIDDVITVASLALKDIGGVIQSVDDRYGFSFSRNHAETRTNLIRGVPVVRAWLNMR